MQQDLGARLAEQGIPYVSGSARLTCPKCQGGTGKEKSLGVTVDEDGLGATWQCFRGTCGFRGGTRVTQKVVAVITPQPPASKDPTIRQRMIKWFARRGISAETIDRFGVEAVEQNFGKGDEWAFAFSYPTGAKKYRAASHKAFVQTKGGAGDLFNGQSIGKEKPVIFCEGEMDVLAFSEAGFHGAVSMPDGAPAPGHAMGKRFDVLAARETEITGLNEVYIATDQDPPGHALANELIRRFGPERCLRVRFPDGCKDANDVLVAHGREALATCIDQAEPVPIKALVSPNDLLPDLLGLYDGGRKVGLSTGFRNLDPLLTIRPGELSVVTGIPSAGKSEFIDAVCMNMARMHGWRVALCSFENPPDEHLAKLVEKQAGQPFWPGPTPRMDRDRLNDAVQWVNDHFLFIRSYDESPTFDWIISRASAAVFRFGINALVIDPYNEIEHVRPNGQSETEYISQILSKAKRFAQTHGVHVFFIAHPAKLYRIDGEIPIPSLYDISGSANWVNKADIGLVVHRDSADRTTVYVRKVRFKEIGQPGEVHFTYNRATGRYSEYDDSAWR